MGWVKSRDTIGQTRPLRLSPSANTHPPKVPLNKAMKMSSEEEMHRRKNIKAFCYFSYTVASLYQAHNVPLTHCVWMLPSSCSVCLCSCWRWKVSSSLNAANLQSPPLPVFSSHAKPWARQRTEDLLRLRDTPGRPYRRHKIKADWEANV